MFQFLIPAALTALSAAGNASQQKAAKRQAQAAQSATDQNIAEQRRQYDQTRADQMPFLQSDYARRAMADRSYGIQNNNMMGSVQGPNMNDARIGQPDYGSYVRNNPDLMAAYSASNGQYGGIEDFGNIHYQTHGQGEGRQLGMFQAPQMQTAAQGQASGQSFDPLADFNASGDRALLNYEPAINSVNAAFSAKGAGLDSSASNALGKTLTGMTQNAFYNWRSGLEGSPTGAAGAIGSAGQNMASNNMSQRNALADSLGSSYQNRANSTNNMINNFSSILGGFNRSGGNTTWSAR